MRINYWAEFDQEKHFKPKLKRRKFEKLKSWKLGWFLLESINIVDDEKKEIEITKQFSQGQKLLHFFWNLDSQITNGGFIQFYINQYDKYVPAIIEGLILIGDNELIGLIHKAESLFNTHKDKLEDPMIFKDNESFEALYDDLSDFEELDNMYYEIHNNTMSLIERYARINLNEFCE